MRALALLAASALAGCAPGQPRAQAEPALAHGRATIALGESARIAGVTVRALRIEEDSRCPASVQCVQAGTVRLRVALDREPRETVLRLNEAQTVGSGPWIELFAVCPDPRASRPAAPAAYRFTLIAAHGAIAPAAPGPCPPTP
ncbi:MAG TPA: hypothetical protein VD887_11480 [Allosphingosinicella sp.]|nr:hypothetical protein [Allosphingosinicella sp.]